MAQNRTKTLIKSLWSISSNVLNKEASSKNVLRCMSQYPSYYIRPVYEKSIQDEMAKTGEISKLSHLPTRAALNDQTCSQSHDTLVNLFINYVMRDGNKVLARTLVEQTLAEVKRLQLQRYHKSRDEEAKNRIVLNPKEVFHRAVENCKPILNLSPIKRGGVTYQVPVPITDRRSRFMSMKWLIEAGQDKASDKRFFRHLAEELVDACNGTGRVIRKKQELHKQCEANRAYAHYRWS